MYSKLENILDKRFNLNSQRNPVFFVNDFLRPAIKTVILKIIEEKVNSGMLLVDDIIKVNDVCLSGFGVSHYFNDDDQINISIFASIHVDIKNSDILDKLISNVKYIPFLYKDEFIKFFDKTVNINFFSNYDDCEEIELYSVLKNKWVRKFESAVPDNYKSQILSEYKNIDRIVSSLYEKYKFLPVNKYNLKQLEDYYILYFVKYNNSKSLFKKQLLNELYEKSGIRNRLKGYILRYSSNCFGDFADEYFIKDMPLRFELDKYYAEKELNQKKYNNTEEIIADLDNIVETNIELKNIDCPLLFQNGKLRDSVKKVLNAYANDFIDNLKIDKKLIKDVYIGSSSVGRFYNNDSDIDIHIVLDLETIDVKGYGNLINCLKYVNKLNFVKKYFIFDKAVDFLVIANENYSFSCNKYSLKSDCWIDKIQVEDCEYDKNIILNEVKNIHNMACDLTKAYSEYGLNEKSYATCLDLFNVLYRNESFYDLFYNKEKNYEIKNIRIIKKILNKYFIRYSPFDNLSETYNSILSRQFENIISTDYFLCQKYNVNPSNKKSLDINGYIVRAKQVLNELVPQKSLSNLFFNENETLVPVVNNYLKNVAEYWSLGFRKDIEDFFVIEDICLEGDFASFIYDEFSVIDLTIYVNHPDYVKDFSDYLDGFVYGIKNKFVLFNKPIEVKVLSSKTNVISNSYSLYKDKWNNRFDLSSIDKKELFESIKAKLIYLEQFIDETSISNFKEEKLEEIWKEIRYFYNNEFNSIEESAVHLICKKINLIDYVQEIFDNYQSRKVNNLFVEHFYNDLSHFRNPNIFNQFLPTKLPEYKDLPDKEIINHLESIEYKFKETRNPAFFDENEVINEQIRNYLIDMANDFYKYSPFNNDNVKILDICLCSSQAGKYYKNSSDIDLHIYLDFEGESIKDHWTGIPCYFSNVHFGKYLKGFKLFTKHIDIGFMTSANRNVSCNSYSLLDNKWKRRTENEDINVDFRGIEKEFSLAVEKLEKRKEYYSNKAINSKDINELVYLKADLLGSKYLYIDGEHKRKDYETSNTRLKFKLLKACGYLTKSGNYIGELISKYWRSEEINNVLNNFEFIENTYIKKETKISKNIDGKLNYDYANFIISNSDKINSYIKEYIAIYFDDSLIVKDVSIVGDYATKYYDDASQLDLFVDVEYNPKSKMNIESISYLLMINEFISKFSKYRILNKEINIHFNSLMLENENQYSVTNKKWIKKDDNYKSDLIRKNIYDLSPLPSDMKAFAVRDMISIVNNKKPFRNPMLFENDVLHLGVSNKLKEIGLECFDKLKSKLEFIELSDVVISGSLASFTYSNASDLDIHVILKNRSFSNHEITEFTKTFNGEIDGYNLLGKQIDIVFKFDTEKNYSASEYSVINNKWNSKATSEDYTYDADNIRSMAMTKFEEFEKLKQRFNNSKANISELINFRNSLIITHQFFVAQRISIEKNIDLTDYKKYFAILKKTGFIFEVEDLISDVLNRKYFN